MSWRFWKKPPICAMCVHWEKLRAVSVWDKCHHDKCASVDNVTGEAKHMHCRMARTMVGPCKPFGLLYKQRRRCKED